MKRRRWSGYRDGRPLPIVPPHVDRDGRVYYTEYASSEQHCGRRGPPWLNAVVACSRKRACGCSDHERITNRMYAPFGPTIDGMRRAGLIGPREMDESVPPREALRRIRPYLPHIKTPAQLFVATAWQPFKAVFERGWVGYINFALVQWARAPSARPGQHRGNRFRGRARSPPRPDRQRIRGAEE